MPPASECHVARLVLQAVSVLIARLGRSGATVTHGRPYQPEGRRRATSPSMVRTNGPAAARLIRLIWRARFGWMSVLTNSCVSGVTVQADELRHLRSGFPGDVQTVAYIPDGRMRSPLPFGGRRDVSSDRWCWTSIEKQYSLPI